MATQHSTPTDHARTLIRRLVKQWQCTEGISATDLLDEIANEARHHGIVTPDDIESWCADSVTASSNGQR